MYVCVILQIDPTFYAFFSITIRLIIRSAVSVDSQSASADPFSLSAPPSLLLRSPPVALCHPSASPLPISPSPPTHQPAGGDGQLQHQIRRASTPPPAGRTARTYNTKRNTRACNASICTRLGSFATRERILWSV